MKTLLLFLCLLTSLQLKAFELNKNEQRSLSYCAVIANNYLADDILDDKAYLLHLYAKLFIPKSRRVSNTELKIKHGLKLVKVKINISEQKLCQKLEEIVLARTKKDTYKRNKRLAYYLKYSISLHKELLPLSDSLSKLDEELSQLGFQKELRDIAKLQQQEVKAVTLPAYLSSRNPEILLAKERFGVADSERVKSLKTSAQWLLKQQNVDGSWGKSSREVITALALKSVLLSFKDIQDKESFAKIDKAFAYLVKYFKKRSRISLYGVGEALLCQALIELSPYHKIKELKEETEKQILKIIKAQNADGGFSESFFKDMESSLPVSIYCTEALWFAKLAGIRLREVNIALDKSRRFLTSMKEPKGYYRFSSKKKEIKSVFSKETLFFIGNQYSSLFKQDYQIKTFIKQENLFEKYRYLKAHFYLKGLDYTTFEKYWKELINLQDNQGLWSLDMKAEYFNRLTKDQSLLSTVFAREILALDFAYKF